MSEDGEPKEPIIHKYVVYISINYSVWSLTYYFLNLQPLRLDIKRKLTSRSDRVKSVDLHPSEPWMLCALYNGHVHVMNYENQQMVKDFEVKSINFKCLQVNYCVLF